MKQIENFPDYYITEDGDLYSERSERFLSGGKTQYGYTCHRIRNDETAKTVYPHRLVLRHFGSEPPTEDHQVNHIDGDKENNHISNLEWTTASENMKHSYENEFHNIDGDKHPSSKLTEEEVLEIRRRHTNTTQQELANEFGVARSTISQIVNRIRWTHI